ncbi:MAG: aminoacyl-tRNA hydrolase [Proteobacteria bacterium]|nr:aminoacyl-tRNA hydrolase [Pseudomonadota bacterium]
MIQITKDIAIDDKEIRLEFIRASGPGGQNVNKVASAVQLRFDVKNSKSLPDDVRERLSRLAGKSLTKDGILVLTARRFRRQERNRLDALDRLVGLLRRAARKPKIHRKTRPPFASKLNRLENKRRRSKTKELRHLVKKLDD